MLAAYCIKSFCYKFLYNLYAYRLEVKLPGIWTDGKAAAVKSHRRKTVKEKEPVEKNE